MVNKSFCQDYGELFILKDLDQQLNLTRLDSTQIMTFTFKLM